MLFQHFSLGLAVKEEPGWTATEMRRSVSLVLLPGACAWAFRQILPRFHLNSWKSSCLGLLQCCKKNLHMCMVRFAHTASNSSLTV